MLLLTPFITVFCLILAFILGIVFARFLGCMGRHIFYGEILLAILFVLTVFRYGIALECVLMLFFICILYLVSVTDIYDQIIPDGCLITAIVIRILYFCFVGGFQWKGLLGLIGNGLAVSLPLLFLVLLMEKIWKKEVMGGGDIKLLFVTGMYIGWVENLLAIFVACIIGIIMGLRIEIKEDASGYFPFGPSIALGVVVSMLCF